MCSQRQHLSHCVILSVLLSLWMDLTSGMMNIQLIPQYPVIEGSVTLSVTGITGRILTFTWYKGPNTNAENQILTYIPGDPSPQLNGPLYFSRAKPLPAGSLIISDLNTTDSGIYTVNVQTQIAALDAFVNLTVYEFSQSTTSGMDVGAIIGIVVAVLLSVALVTVLIYVFIIRKRRNKPSNNMNSVMEIPSKNGQTSTPPVDQRELQYAEIEFKKNIPRKQQQPPGPLCDNRRAEGQPPSENVVYSDLRLQ